MSTVKMMQTRRQIGYSGPVAWTDSDGQEHSQYVPAYDMPTPQEMEAFLDSLSSGMPDPFAPRNEAERAYDHRWKSRLIVVAGYPD